MTESQVPAARPDAEAGGRTFDPQEILRILIGQRWLLLAVTFVVVATTALVTFTAVPYWRARQRVLIERQGSQVVSFKEIYDLATAGDDYYATQHKILESRAVAERAFLGLAAEDRAWFDRRQDPLGAFMSLVAVVPVPKSRLVDVQAEHPDPAVASRMAAAMVAAYVQDTLDRRSSASTSALARLQADGVDLQKRLVEAEKSLQEFKQSHEIVSMGDRQSLVAARLEKLNEEVSTIEWRRGEAESRLRVAEKAVADASFTGDLPEALENPVVANCKRALLDTQQEMSQLAQTYKPQHPRMLALERKAEAVRVQLAEEIRSINRTIRSAYDRLVHQAGDARARLEGQKKALLDLESKALQYQMLKDEVDNTRRLHETVLSRLKEVQVMNNDDSTNIHCIGRPEVGNVPVRPRRMLNLAAALIGGLLLACGFAFAIDAFDRSFKVPAEAARILATPVLGLVPHVPGKRSRGGAGAVRGPNDKETYDPHSTVSEAFRTIRTGLTFSDAGRGTRSLVVTSAVPGEGKSFVSIHLAVSLARDGKRVLLVDADMRRPRLHRAFAMSVEEGFSSLLIGQRDPAELALATPQPGLWVMPCGIIPPNPVELLGGERMKSVLQDLLGRYDVVILDSPPAGVVSDACVLATLADRVVFVVRGFSTDRGVSRRAVAGLRSVGARVAGLVLNHADARADRYYGAYGSSYGYRQDDRYGYGTRDAAATTAGAAEG